MSIEQILKDRSGNQCELSGSSDDLVVYAVPPVDGQSADRAILISQELHEQINGEQLDPNLWRGLNDAMWSQEPPVQVMAWRMLKRLTKQGETWAQDLLDMLYLDDALVTWAESGLVEEEQQVIQRDNNGVKLEAGDNVVLIKDLDVKGTSFTAKRGTPVRGISLTDNPDHIEGRVNGVRIVILTKFVKKQ
ncbi:PhnA domain-containing protein [Neiella marina]|uniref:PhnA domain-containing protein n=1 Tax=Neiella holothuriorum TaxID=2870530 RepID=A0ABS7EM16_9GAMM|nr:alkylphosphonate utilization protein [Neiella holothuriorum]MBW8192641.1 PhnA domain-containing protein [Neiella holothuriorum]